MWRNVRAFLAGSGADFFSTTEGTLRLLELAGRLSPSSSAAGSSSSLPSLSSPLSVGYIGTATYDQAAAAEKQLRVLQEVGCDIVPICVANVEKERLTAEEEAFIREEADIVLVSGGNTSFAIRRWEETGLTAVLKEVIAQSVTKDSSRKPLILAGGSAGAICWCTSGHSDSADPSTYMIPFLLKANGREKEIDPESTSTNWSFIRVHGLDIFPGLLCPHYDTVGGNGVAREQDFEHMLKRHSTERGVGIDHWAALILNGDGTYEVFVIPASKRGGATTTTTRKDENALGVYTLEVVGSPKSATTAGEPASSSPQQQNSSSGSAGRRVDRKMVPMKGKVENIFRPPTGPVIKDPFEMFFSMSNPTPSSPSLPRR